MNLRAVSISKGDNTAFMLTNTNKEYLYYLNFLNLRNTILNLRVVDMTEIQGSSEFLQAETGKMILSPRETPKLDMSRYMLREKRIQKGGSRGRFLLSATSYRGFQKAELRLLGE